MSTRAQQVIMVSNVLTCDRTHDRPTLRRLCIETHPRGSRVTGAWFAALAIEWGFEWITLDRDYARGFPG
jgi:hypothetical protein